MLNTNGQFQTTPLYIQVRNAIAERISQGEWKPGVLIPNERALAQAFGVSSGTMRKALDLLEYEGTLTRKQGRGTFVNDIQALAVTRMQDCEAKAQAVIDEALDEVGTRSLQKVLDPLKQGIAKALFEAGSARQQ